MNTLEQAAKIKTTLKDLREFREWLSEGSDFVSETGGPWMDRIIEALSTVLEESER